MLRFPRMRDHRSGLAALAPLERAGDGRPMAVMPCGLNQDVATVTIARFRDRAAAFARTGRMLGWHQAPIRHELRRALEAAPVAEFGDEHHRAEGVDCAVTLETAHRRGVDRAQGERL